ncbi:hypothetical protein D9M69_491380 [compost metagenome]
MGHVDHPEQAEGDRQAERGEQQDRAEAHAAERLAEQVAEQQAALDLGQAGFGGGAHRGVAFRAVGQQRFQARARQRVAGLAEQAHGVEADRRVRIDQLQVGQGQGQGVAHAVVRFAGDPRIEQRQLRRFGGLLQLAGGGQAYGRLVGEQLVAGLGAGQQAAQAVVQAQLLRRAAGRQVALGGVELAVFLDERGLGAVDGQAAALQRIEQGQARRIGRGGPVLEQLGLLGGIGGDEVAGIAGLGGQRREQQRQ